MKHRPSKQGKTHRKQIELGGTTPKVESEEVKTGVREVKTPSKQIKTPSKHTGI